MPDQEGLLILAKFPTIDFKSWQPLSNLIAQTPKRADSPETLFDLIKKKPITPSNEEIIENPPSRSAKFRYVIKKRDFYNFDTDIEEKFRNLIEIENYGDKL